MARTEIACEGVSRLDCRGRPCPRREARHRRCVLLALTAGLWILCSGGSAASQASRNEADRHIREGIKWFTDARSGEEFERAVTAFQKAVRACPDYIPAHVWLGVAYVESDRSEERVQGAIAEFERALAIPDRQNRYEGYLGSARRRLLRLQGRPRVVALCLDAGSDPRRREAGDRIVDAVRTSFISKDYRVLAGSEIGYSPTSVDSTLYAKGRKKGMGWIALINIKDFLEPSRSTDRRGKDYWTASVQAGVGLLDCEMKRRLPPFSASSFQHVKVSQASSQDVFNRAADNCGKSLAEKMLGVVAREDQMVREGCAARSVPTGIPMLFAETSVRDRKQARQMDIIVFPMPKVETGSLDPDKSYTASLTVRQTIRKTIMDSGKYSIISYTELEKLRDRPGDWTPEKAASFARKVGENCKAVLVTRLTRCQTTVGGGLGRTTVRAAVYLAATVISRDAATTSLDASVSDKRTYWLTNEADVAEKKEKMLITVAEKAVKELCDKLQAVK